MRNFLAHTDLTNPEKYNAMIRNNNRFTEIKMEEKEYAVEMNGVIHTTAMGFDVFFEDGKYYISDCYGNEIYLTNWNNRQKVFAFYAQNNVQFISGYYNMSIAIARFFGRTKTNYFNQILKLSEVE